MQKVFATAVWSSPGNELFRVQAFVEKDLDLRSFFADLSGDGTEPDVIFISNSKIEEV